MRKSPTIRIALVPLVFVIGCATPQRAFDAAAPHAEEGVKKRAQRKVVLRVVVGTDGSPTTVQVAESSGHIPFDEEAVGAVKKRYHWPPGAVRVYMVPMVFSLE